MCGFVGNVNFNSNRNYVQITKKILKKIKHRGPDDSRVLKVDNYTFGFNRLSIVATNSKYANQPLRIGQHILIFNGEIYNYNDLTNLVSIHIKDKSNFGDTEVLFHLIKKYGIDYALKKIKGMFSFAWVDIKNNSIQLCRDRIGEKPLYYFKNNEDFWFSSEIKGITLTGQTSREINKNKINDYFSNGKINGKYTFFKDIYEVEPGQIINLNTVNKKISKKNYWRLDKKYKNKINNISDAFPYVKKLLSENTEKIRINGDDKVKIGLLTSAGVDSNAILSILFEKKLIKNLEIFTAKNHLKEFDESKNVIEIINKYNKKEDIIKKPHLAKLNIDENLKIINKLSYYNDEPIPFLMSPILYKLCKLARKNKVKVLISGEGSDEIFYGYERYFETNKKLKKLKDTKKIIDLIYFGAGLKNKKLITQITNQKSFKDTPGYKWLIKNINKYDKNLIQQIYRQKFIFQNLLQRNDRIGMSESIEIRAPFISHELFEYANTLDHSIKVKNNYSKYLLRKLFKNNYNNLAMEGKTKLPFPTTFKKFLYSNRFNKELIKLISKKNSFSLNFLNIKTIKRLIIKHFDENKDYHNLLWKIYSLEIWYKQIYKYYKF